MSNVLYCLCVWLCLHTTLIKATIWLRGSIPLLSPLIRQEGCQLWALCCGLNSQTSPLNWTPELSMCTGRLPPPALVFAGGVGGQETVYDRAHCTTSCLCLEGWRERRR